MKRPRMKLIPEWKHAHRYASVRFAALGMLLSAAGAAFVAGATAAGAIWAYVPTLIACSVGFVVFACVIAGRVLTKVEDK